MGLCVVSTFWLLWIMLLWAFTDKFLRAHRSSFNLGSCRNFAHQFLFLLGKQIGEGLLSHKVSVMFNFIRTCQTIPENLPHFVFPPAMYESSGCPGCSPALGILFFSWPYQEACGILVPQAGWNPRPLHWKRGVLNTGWPGKFHAFGIFKWAILTELRWPQQHLTREYTLLLSTLFPLDSRMLH